MNPAERYRRNAYDCRQRSALARLPADRADWLKIAEEWQKLAEEVDAAKGRTMRRRQRGNEHHTIRRRVGIWLKAKGK